MATISLAPRLEADQSMAVLIWLCHSPAPALYHWANGTSLSLDPCSPSALPLSCARDHFRPSDPTLLPIGSQVTQSKTHPSPQAPPQTCPPFLGLPSTLLTISVCLGPTVSYLFSSHSLSTCSNSPLSCQPLPAASSSGVSKSAHPGTSYLSQVTWTWVLICCAFLRCYCLVVGGRLFLCSPGWLELTILLP